MKIYCTECKKDIQARLINGEEAYPHRPDLYSLPFWKCDTCKNFVGCHHKHHDPKYRTQPLGYIASKELKALKIKIHNIIDPLWKSGQIERKHLYSRISKVIGYTYHTGELKSVEDANKIIKLLNNPKG